MYNADDKQQNHPRQRKGRNISDAARHQNVRQKNRRGQPELHHGAFQ